MPSGFFADLAHGIARADPALIGSTIAIAAALSGVGLWRAWANLNKVRLIEDMPTSKVRSAAQGYVELEGTARAMDGAPTIAPLSGLSCCWYRFLVEEQVTTRYNNRTETRWQTVDRGESTDTFWLEDDTGRVAVDPEGADIEPKHKDVWRSGSSLSNSPAMPAHVVTFMQSFVATHRSGNPHRFTEWRINRGDPVFAIGLLKNVGSHATLPSVDEEVRALLRDWKQDQPTLQQRFDLNKDGKIDEKEWMLARAQARREALKQRTQQMQQFAESINLLGPTQDRNRPYILSAYPQTKLLARYRWRAGLYGLGFFGLGTLAVWLFNTRFG
jgi:hypothetical protein